MMINRMRLMALEKRSLGVSFTSPLRSETNHCKLLLFHVDDFFISFFTKPCSLLFAPLPFHITRLTRTKQNSTQKAIHKLPVKWHVETLMTHRPADKGIFTRPDNRLCFAAVALAIFPWGEISDCFAFCNSKCGAIMLSAFLRTSKRQWWAGARSWCSFA